MGPKDKLKSKKTETPDQEEDTSENVTELMKEMFEIQLSDIDAKIKAHTTRQQELREMAEALEHTIVEHQKLKGLVIDELKAQLEEKEEEKVRKRKHLEWLVDEVKLNRQRLEEAVAEKRKKIDDMMEEMAESLEVMNETVNILINYKKNKETYNRELEEREKELQEAERQHRRDVFAIMQKLNLVKSKLKKDLESRLLQLSIDFQATNRIKIGAPIHRMMQENRAIENELGKIGSAAKVFEVENDTFKEGIKQLRAQEKPTVEGRDKLLARCIIQSNIMKELQKVHDELAEKMKEFLPHQTENDFFMKKFKVLENQVEKKKAQASYLRMMFETKKKEANRMNEISLTVKKNMRKLGILIRNALRAAEEAMAVRLIPLGETEEEKFMSEEAKLKMYRRRRDFAFKKKGRCLNNLKEILLRAQLTREEWKMLESPAANRVDFYGLFSETQGPPGEGFEQISTELGRKSTSSLTESGSSDSLPRSLTPEELQMQNPLEETGAAAERATVFAEPAKPPEASGGDEAPVKPPMASEGDGASEKAADEELEMVYPGEEDEEEWEKENT